LVPEDYLQRLRDVSYLLASVENDFAAALRTQWPKKIPTLPVNLDLLSEAEIDDLWRFKCVHDLFDQFDKLPKLRKSYIGDLKNAAEV
jgi:hypothetical protein